MLCRYAALKAMRAAMKAMVRAAREYARRSTAATCIQVCSRPYPEIRRLPLPPLQDAKRSVCLPGLLLQTGPLYKQLANIEWTQRSPTMPHQQFKEKGFGGFLNACSMISWQRQTVCVGVCLCIVCHYVMRFVSSASLCWVL